MLSNKSTKIMRAIKNFITRYLTSIILHTVIQHFYNIFIKMSFKLRAHRKFYPSCLEFYHKFRQCSRKPISNFIQARFTNLQRKCIVIESTSNDESSERAAHACFAAERNEREQAMSKRRRATNAGWLAKGFDYEFA